MKKFVAMLLAVMLLLSVFSFASAEEGRVFKIGLCNYVDDASLNQIVENIQAQLEAIGQANGVTFVVDYQNCNARTDLLNQIVAGFIADDVDLMIGVATPVAMTMQGATEDNKIPVVFAAVSDPLGAGLVADMAAPGANVTGTSDYLDTNAVMNLVLAMKPDAAKVGLLYDLGQDSSTAAIAEAKAFLTAHDVAYVEATGASTSEVMMAVSNLIYEGVDAVFTPSDNTVMTAELAIYEQLATAGIPHFTGADSFALNGAFLGYGVDYANLGVETANMVAKILLEGMDPAEVPVMTFDNGTATVNTEICEMLNVNYEEIAAIFAPFCTQVQPIVLAESFNDLQ